MMGRLLFLVRGVFLWLGVIQVRAWDYEGHYVTNQLALASLPTNFPASALTPAAQARIAVLAGEPDRWRNSRDLELRQANPTGHYRRWYEAKAHGWVSETPPPIKAGQTPGEMSDDSTRSPEKHSLGTTA